MFEKWLANFAMQYRRTLRVRILCRRHSKVSSFRHLIVNMTPNNWCGKCASLIARNSQSIKNQRCAKSFRKKIRLKPTVVSLECTFNNTSIEHE